MENKLQFLLVLLKGKNIRFEAKYDFKYSVCVVCFGLTFSCLSADNFITNKFARISQHLEARICFKNKTRKLSAWCRHNVFCIYNLIITRVLNLSKFH